ncbi:uncharacterized protein LOC126376389 [Pectinophora gossypiella]|uniref:uncharacterized protein LOC126376389 n=1 Tax=Pectinophora gossypiella TaxID=13191 RepID=UPI00214ED5F3|nr:uncharacterized protein LOC126376389 [Pectinophora gossypiella]
MEHGVNVSLPYDERAAEMKCQELAKQPYFDPEMVVGRPWRVYYSWNMKFETKCLDMYFKQATPAIIRRIYNDMLEYLIEQPTWGAASLLVAMGHNRKELLLFDDQGPAGRFVGVPDVMRDGNISPIKNSVPLLKFQMKLIENGRFLVTQDCQVGIGELSVRLEDEPTRAEILSVAKSLGHIFGDGSEACVQDFVKSDNILA